MKLQQYLYPIEVRKLEIILKDVLGIVGLKKVSFIALFPSHFLLPKDHLWQGEEMIKQRILYSGPSWVTRERIQLKEHTLINTAFLNMHHVTSLMFLSTIRCSIQVFRILRVTEESREMWFQKKWIKSCPR